LGHHSGPIGARAGDLWAREGDDPGWAILDLARDILVAIDILRGKLDRWVCTGDALRDYARGSHCVDQDYRRLRAMLSDSIHAHDRLRDRCARSYRDVLRRMNDRFTMLLETEGHWPPRDNPLPPQDHFWAEVAGERESNQRVADRKSVV